MTAHELTINKERLQELLHYEPVTGVFTWRVSSRVLKVGDIAGHKQSKGYLAVWLDGKKYLLHRLAFLYMTGAWPKNQVDHIDRNKTHNAWDNLRDVDGTVNLGNAREIWNHNKSGTRGVLYYPRYGKWQASLKFKGTQLYLGRFEKEADAIAARKAAEEKYFGAGC